MDERWPGSRGRDGGIDEIPVPGPGRLWLCGKHVVGPDPEQALVRAGATTIVCLNERDELADRYPGYVAWLEANPDRAVWHPVPDLHPPADAQLLVELQRRLDAGERLLLHCGAGIGRAGTVAAALLIATGVPRAEALAVVRAHRPSAGPEAGPQTAFLDGLQVGAVRPVTDQ